MLFTYTIINSYEKQFVSSQKNSNLLSIFNNNNSIKILNINIKIITISKVLIFRRISNYFFESIAFFFRFRFSLLTIFVENELLIDYFFYFLFILNLIDNYFFFNCEFFFVFLIYFLFVCFLFLRLLSRHKVFKLTFFVNFSSNVLFNKIIETAFVIREFIILKYQYVENLLKICKAIINSIIIINFELTKYRLQQITKIFIVKLFDYFNN